MNITTLLKMIIGILDIGTSMTAPWIMSRGILDVSTGTMVLQMMNIGNLDGGISMVAPPVMSIDTLDVCTRKMYPLR